VVAAASVAGVAAAAAAAVVAAAVAAATETTHSWLGRALPRARAVVDPCAWHGVATHRAHEQDSLAGDRPRVSLFALGLVRQVPRR
jgi:hypothetical protein